MTTMTDHRTFDPIRAADLRRRRNRDLAETLVERAQWLTPADRALVQAIYRDGVTARDVAALRSESPRTVRRHTRLLVQRMLSPSFSFVIGRREQWPPTRRRVATACVLQGRTLRDAAEHLRLSLHAVRRQMEAVHTLQEAARS